MDKYLSKVGKILDLAESKRMTDRRKFLQELHDVYANNDFVGAIDAQTATDPGGACSWNGIMMAVHRVALLFQDGDKPPCKNPRGSATVMARSSCSSLMLETARLATNNNAMSLNCEDLMAASFDIWSNRMNRVYHDTYMKIFVRHVLGNETYRLEITGAQWREILRLSTKMYEDSSDEFKSNLLDVVRLVVRYGCLQSHLLPHVKKILPFLEKVFHDVGTKKEFMLKQLYKLTYTVCLQIGTESRIALCEFSENILPPIVSLEASPEMYKMLLILVKMHHPGGAMSNEDNGYNDGAYARDWNLWKNIIRGIYSNVVKEIKTKKLDSWFLELYCEVYHQVSRDSTYLAEASSSETVQHHDGIPHKVRCLTVVVDSPVEMLRAKNNPREIWPFVQILTELLGRYPNSLKSDDYLEFLIIVEKLLDPGFDNETIFGSLCELLKVLIDHEKRHYEKAEHAEAVAICWQQIWAMVLRATSANTNETTSHELVRSMMRHRDVTNVQSYPRLCLSRSIGWSSTSLETLLVYLTHKPEFTSSDNFDPANSQISMRSSLMQWALDVPTGRSIPVITLANLLTRLTMKSRRSIDHKDRFDIATIENNLEIDLFDDRESMIERNVETCNLSLIFQTDVFENLVESKRIDDSSSSCNHEIVKHVFTTLIDNLRVSMIDSTNEDNDVVSRITRINLAAWVMSNFAEYDVAFDDDGMKKFIRAFSEAYRNVQSIITTMNETPSSSNVKVEALEAFEKFYCTQYHSKVDEIIVESTSSNFIKFIDESSKLDDSKLCKFDENLEKTNVRTKIICTNDCRVINSMEKMFTYQICGRAFERTLDDRTTILKNFTKTFNDSNCSLNTFARRTLRFLRVCEAFDDSATSKVDPDLRIALVRQLLKKQRRNERIVVCALKLIPGLMRASMTMSTSGSCDSIVVLLAGIEDRLKLEHYGPHVYAEFVKCLARLIVENPNSQNFQSMIKRLTNYIDNQFYMVRLEVVRVIYVIFESQHIEISRKIDIFDDAMVAVKNFLVTGEGTADEVATRTVTAVDAIAAIVRADCSPKLQIRGVRALVEVHVDNGVSARTIKRALVVSARKNFNDNVEWPRRLFEINLYEILSQWLDDDRPIERFPWIFLNCNRLEEFLLNYIDILIICKLRRLEFHHIEIMCENLHFSFSEIVDKCFPTIMTLIAFMKIPNSTNNEATIAYATNIHKNLVGNIEMFSKVKKFTILMNEKLSEILIDIFQRFHDEQHFVEIFDENCCSTNWKNEPLTFDDYTVEQCFKLLETDLRLNNESLMKHLIVRRPWILQKISLALATSIRDDKSTKNDVQALHRYVYFCTILMKHMSNDYFDPMSLWTIREITHTLLNLMKEMTLVSRLVCRFFEKFIEAALPRRANEMKQMLSHIVSTLIPIVQSEKIPIAINVLHRLIVKHEETLARAIETLDTFPNELIFADVKRVHDKLKYRDVDTENLEMEIKHFLRVVNEKTLICSVEGLSRLNEQLSMKKMELNRMYDKLKKLRGFSEDCATSLIHKLIYKLVRLTKSTNPDVTREAAKCLGQIGPADLTTIILHPEKSYIDDPDDDNCDDNFTINVIKQLSDYIVDDDSDLKRLSAEALYGIFATRWGCKFVDKNYLNQVDRRIGGTIDSTVYDFIYPFVATANITWKHRRSTVTIDRDYLIVLLNQSDDLWIPNDYDSYEKWMIALTFRILDCFVDFYALTIKPVCARSIELCEMIVPRLVDLLINANNSLTSEFSNRVDKFFERVFELTRSNDDYSPVNADTNMVVINHDCIRTMLNVVKFMRTNSLRNNRSLDVNYLFIANAADHTSAYFPSLLYAELSCRALSREFACAHENNSDGWISVIDEICVIDPRAGKLLQHIVREAYLHIDDPDSIYGCGLSHSIDCSFRSQHYTHIGRWDKVVLEQDMELGCSDVTSRRDMLNALQKSGHTYLLGVVMADESGGESSDNVQDFMYEAAWRLADWNLIGMGRGNDSVDDNNSSISRNSNVDDFHSSHYRALCHLRDGNVDAFTNALNNARTSIVNSLRKKTLECSQTVYPILSQLQMLREIEEFAAETSNPENCDKLMTQWNSKDYFDTHDFRYVEPILSQRLTMCKIRKSGSDVPSIMDRAIIENHLNMAEIAEKQGYLSMASRALDTLAEMIDLPDDAFHRLTYQKALLAWKEEEFQISRHHLKYLIRKPRLNPSLRAKALRICGNWMAEIKCEKPQTIVNDYFDESIKTSLTIESPSHEDMKDLAEARSDLGQFADAQYQRIIRFAKSGRCKNLETRSNNDSDEEVNDDASQFREGKEDIDGEKYSYLVLAMNNYLKTLQSSNDHDLLIYRLVSLWFDNTFYDQLNVILDENLPRIASYKFIAVLCQIAPHMSNSSNVFTEKIKNLMERCAKEHPHHTLPILMALKNTHKDKDFEGSRKGSRKSSNARSEPRVEASAALVSQLMNTKLRPIIQEISQLSHALVGLAYYTLGTAEGKKTGPFKIPSRHDIMRIRNFQHTVVPTMTLNVNPTGNYDNIVSISEYVDTFVLPGGVNKPKKLICVGTDGIRRSQLVKGHDDLRQDAVMEQVFTVMNTMLKTNRETKRRRLHIRTYKIVPLSQRSGILEWCNNTIPISQVLMDSPGKPGLHTKYYPNDWNTSKCRMKLSEVMSKSRSEKLETFLECCKNLHPAFHHFFMEKYPSAETWFERRLAYVRSVATTSMVGYMLGLGDRHFSNILIDQTTAEVIHIDFGIAFAQGKTLKIPETVPFRLTRDMEVAMGICGVEGVMRRSCEVTVAVLRLRREILITVLQVLLYDPLFSWAITPLETNDLAVSGSRYSRGLTDHQDEKKTNEIAEKALLKIDEKLQGTADGLRLSISGQVERLIQQARDPANLCRLFCGWQPYL